MAGGRDGHHDIRRSFSAESITFATNTGPFKIQTARYRAAAAVDEVGLVMAMVTGILVDGGAPLLPPHRAHILPIICGLHRGGK